MEFMCFGKAILYFVEAFTLHMAANEVKGTDVVLRTLYIPCC